MIAWFKALDFASKAWIVLLAIMLVAVAIGTGIHFIDAAFGSAEQKGAATERAAGTAKTLEHLEKANAAKARYRSDPALRDADCLLDATNPADC